MTKTIKIFLASSEELVDDRTAFKQFIYDETILWKPKGIFFELILWEDYFVDSMSETRKQDDYNKAIKECDIFVLLFFTKVGKYTEEEFNTAYEQFKSTGKPQIFTYFKDANIKIGKIDKRVQSMLDFKERLSELKHFYSVYENKEGLQLDFSKQLDKLEQKNFFYIEVIHPEWLNNYLIKIQNDFTQHMLPQECVTEEVAKKANFRYVELLVQERKLEKLPEKEKPEAQKKTVFPFSELLGQKKTRFLIFGDGGGGKTTSLKKLASDVAGRILSDQSFPIPVFVKLNEFDSSEQSFNSLLKIVSDAANLEPQIFEPIWRKGTRRFLFLFDGFNEVGDAFQDACARALQKFLEVGTHYYFITTRTIDKAEQLGSQLTDITALDIIHLDEDQIKDFLKSHEMAGLFDQMEDQLKSLAQNPFMLWALTQSAAGLSQDKLPSNMGQLYQYFIDQYIFNKREKNKIPSPTTYNYSLTKKPILANLAMQMNIEGVTKIKENEKLYKAVYDQLKKLCADKEGVIDFEPYKFMPYDPPRFPSGKGIINEIVHNDVLRRVGDTLEFMHQSVQDYFAASAIAGIPETTVIGLPINEVIKLTPRFRSRYIILEESGYDNIFKLPDSGNFAESLVMFVGILENVDEFLLQLNSHNYLLAAKCAGVANNIKDETKRKLCLSWKDMLKKENPILKCLGCLCFSYSKFADEELLEMLIKLVENESSQSFLRKNAAKTIGKIDNSDYIEILVNMALSDQEYGKYTWGPILNSIDSQTVVLQLYNSWRDITKEPAYNIRAKELLERLDKKQIANAFSSIPDEMIPQIISESIDTEFEYKGDNFYAHILKVLNAECVVLELFERYCLPNQKDDYYKKIQKYLYYLDEVKIKNELERIIYNYKTLGNEEKVRIADDLLRNYSPSSFGMINATDLVNRYRKAIQYGYKKQELIYQKLKSADIDELQKNLKSEDAHERIVAMKIIGQEKNDISLKILLNQLEFEDYNSGVCQVLIDLLRDFKDKSQILLYFKNNITNPKYSYLLDLDIALLKEPESYRPSSQLLQLFKDNWINVGKEENVSIYETTINHWNIENFNEKKFFEVKKLSSSSFGLFDLNKRLKLIDLAGILNDEVIPDLLKLIDMQEPWIIRKTVLLAVSRFEKFDIITTIEKIFDFEIYTDIIKDCIQLLGETNSELAISPLLKILQKVQIYDTWSKNLFSSNDSLLGTSGSDGIWVKAISEALGKINNKTKVWQSLCTLFDKSNDEVKQITLRVIAELVSDRQAFWELIDKIFLNENPKVRFEGIKLLYKSKYHETDKILLQIAVADDSEKIRKAAIYALRFAEDDNVIQFFIELLKCNEEKKQEYAVFALGELMDETASESLEKLFQQTNNQNIKILIAEALNKIGNYESSTILLERLWPITDDSNEIDILKEAVSVELKIPEADERFYAPIKDALNTNDYYMVIKRVEDRICFLSKDVNLYWWRGIAYQNLKQFEMALSDYDQAIELLSGNVIPEVYYYRALVLGELNRFNDALLDARKATEMDSKRADFQLTLGWCDYKTGQYKESVDASMLTLELDSNSSIAAMAAFNMGLALLALEQPEKAREAYTQGIEICKELQVNLALENLHGALGDLGELAAANLHLNSSVKKCKDILETTITKLNWKD